MAGQTVFPPPETLDELYDHAPCGYLTTRPDGVIVRANATLLDMLGEARDMVLGRPIQAIMTPDASRFFETQCLPLLQLHGLLNEISTDFACAGGGRLPVLVNWRRVDDPGGTLLGYRIMAVNAIEREVYEQALMAERERARQQEAVVRELNANLERRVEVRSAELVQLQKMESLGQLTGGVAHDFNNLLTPILISLEVLHRRYLSDERALRMAASALSAAQRARTLIARLLAFARRQHLRAKAVDLARLTSEMAPIIGRTVGPTVTVQVDVAQDLPPARVDKDQLEMVMLSLCMNARDAMPEGGELTIRGDLVAAEFEGELPIGHYVRLSVSDNGTGMDPETLRRATEPFYSTKGVGKGTGLGLSMVHGMAAQSGGMLVLESTRGKGTIATIWLPVDRGVVLVGDPELTPPAGTAHQGLSILLVDDDELVRFAIGEMLTDLGHTIIQAASGTQALEVLRQHAAFDLLITDYLMPNMTGIGLARAARLLQPGLPVLLVTGYANIKDVDVGGLPRLAKPFGREDLSGAINETMSSRSWAARSTLV